MTTTRIDKLQNANTIMAPNNSFTGILQTQNPTTAEATALASSRVCAMTAKKKFWWQSKTIWVNAITAATATLTVLGGQQIVIDHPAIAAGLVVVLGGLNVGLRIITVLPIGGE